MEIAGCNERGCKNGPRNLAKFNVISGIAFNPNNNCLYVSDLSNNCIRRINTKGMISINLLMSTNFRSQINYLNLEVVTFVGKQEGFLDGQGLNAMFCAPRQLVYSNRGDFFLLADRHNNKIRKITMEGKV